jgi:hypothetical protein
MTPLEKARAEILEAIWSDQKMIMRLLGFDPVKLEGNLPQYATLEQKVFFFDWLIRDRLEIAA